MHRTEWVVHKFGGSSLADAQAYRNAARLVDRDIAERPTTIVVSAMAGVTDSLIGLLSLARDRNPAWESRLDELETRHRQTLAELHSGDTAGETLRGFERDGQQIRHLMRAVGLVRSIPGETLELVSGYGEVWSAQLLARCLQSQGRPAVWLDAREVLVVEQEESGPTIDWKTSAELLRGWQQRNPQRTVVITGYVARLPSGAPTTLKRNGSDFSASIFAALLHADSITIWTDVDGVMSADPRMVPDALVLERLSYDEAMELAYFGAKVIHPKTMGPAVRHGIPIRIRNSRNPRAAGTRVQSPNDQPSSADPRRAVRGFSTFGELCLLNVEGSGMVGVPGIAERLFGALRAVGVSVVMISQASSEHSICLVVPQAQGQQAKQALEKVFYAELHHGQIQQVELSGPVAILAAVGDAMAHTPGVAGRFFGALGNAGVNVRAVAQGSSERNITAVIDQRDETKALRAVHAGFYLSRQTLSVGILGSGGVGSALIGQLRDQIRQLDERFQIDLRIRAIARSGRMQLEDGRIDLAAWERASERDPATDLDALTDHVDSDRFPHAVLIDCTASDEVAARHAEWLERGIHLVTANKKATSGPWSEWDRLRRATSSGRSHYLYEATVGAGLPIIGTLRDLIRTGDRVASIEGVFSGTLSFLFNSLSSEVRFSELVRRAREAGFTEPDPREDLSGIDFARKLIILAREMGSRVELPDVTVESLIPEGLEATVDVEEFLSRIAEQDETMRRSCFTAESEGKVLRYVGRVDGQGRAEVRLRAIPAHEAIGGLRGTDNLVAFTTERYDALPLVVRGPGAGPAVTAGGVFADLLRLASYLGSEP